MELDHRKIDLQSHADLKYLHTNINTAAQQKLDLHFPPSAAPKGEDDAFRAKVEELVQQYIRETMTLALPSVSINGLDTSPTILYPSTTPSASEPTEPSSIDPNDPSYEPYDSRLAGKLRELYATLEAETTRVAELRREAPSVAARSYVERLRKEMDERENEVEERRKEVEKFTEGGLEVIGIERAESVAENWARGEDGLERLRAVTEVVAKLERAERAVVEVEKK